MRALTMGSNSAVFVLFFGAALVEAVRHGDWLYAVIFVVLGALSLRSDAIEGARPTSIR
jgi:hypothetical protein